MSIIEAESLPGEHGGLLPDPDPRAVQFTVISVDDHLVEPAHVFEGRLPKQLQDRAPKIVETETGAQQWEFEGQIYAQLGLNALAGRADRDDFTFEPARFDQMRKGCWDIHERIRDMDINGVWASICFPSQITGFCGRIYSGAKDRELGLAVTKAWNDWLYEEWWGTARERIVPMGITYLADPVAGAAEIRRNAERGFVAVSLPEQPHTIDYPSIHSGYWDPVFEVCQETDTVICLHIGSSGVLIPSAPESGLGVGASLFQAQSYASAVDWVWSGVGLRYPNLKVAFSEGGIGWVPMLLDRLEFQMSKSGHGRKQWPTRDLSPAEVLRRNFYFCTIDDPSTMNAHALARIGADHVMVEVDYPHADTTWPDTQAYLADRLASLPVELQRMVTHENAARLFRHPLPPACKP